MYDPYRVRQQSALLFVLKGLLPYTRENLLLAFKPNAFFNELEKISYYKRKNLENALRQAERQKLVERDDRIIKLTQLGERTIRPFVAEQLPNGSKLMVVFDIPESRASVRARFRRVLKRWRFDQIQKSVWVTAYDHRQSIKEIIAELDIEKYVKIYECASI